MEHFRRMLACIITRFATAKHSENYDKIRSILHVKKALGHRSIVTTQRYVDLHTEIYGAVRPEDYICETVQQSRKPRNSCSSVGLEYVSTMDGEQLYGKVK